MAFYFDRFENRRPEEPLAHSPLREFVWQILATLNLTVGAWYIHWRWTESLNYDALWFALLLVSAETLAYIGLVLFTINLWKVGDTPKQTPPRLIAECQHNPDDYPARPLAVDVFFPTYTEEPELVRLSIRDAKRIHYPHPLDLRIHVLDDGRRPAMRKVAEEEGVNYLTRTDNIGYKAGNLANAMEQTGGDFILICDADTRPFPTILAHTLGYFRDPDVAWVQTPQWFYDIPAGTSLPEVWKKYLGRPGYWLGRGVEKIIGPMRIGEDPLINDPKMFYDVILRRRNAVNAAFCCGAGSIHRREAVMEAAIKGYADNVGDDVETHLRAIRKITAKKNPRLYHALEDFLRREMARDTHLTPYKFHVSEDIYTSIVLHSDPDRNWKSVQHPEVESKMLSPQDLRSWMVQRFKYAGGSLDIAIRDNPLFRPGLRFIQRLMYGATFWSYFGALWNIVFLLAPAFYLFTGISPVAAYTMDFFKHIIPFLILTELAFMVGTWGIPGFKGRASYLAFFSVNLRALWTVLRGHKITFPVTPKTRQEGNFFYLVWPQFGFILLIIAALVYAWTTHYLYINQYTVGGLITNTFWCLNNILALSILVRAALWKPDYAEAKA
jgi:cellulose synthase (UDP-forming)